MLKTRIYFIYLIILNSVFAISIDSSSNLIKNYCDRDFCAFPQDPFTIVLKWKFAHAYKRTIKYNDERIEVRNPADKSFVLNDLTPDMDYKIEMNVMFSKHLSILYSVKQHTSKELLSTIPFVYDLKQDSLHGTIVYIRWFPRKSDLKYGDNFRVQYKVFGDKRWHHSEMSPYTMPVPIKNLLPKSYEFRIVVTDVMANVTVESQSLFIDLSSETGPEIFQFQAINPSPPVPTILTRPINIKAHSKIHSMAIFETAQIDGATLKISRQRCLMLTAHYKNVPDEHLFAKYRYPATNMLASYARRYDGVIEIREPKYYDGFCRICHGTGNGNEIHCPKTRRIIGVLNIETWILDNLLLITLILGISCLVTLSS